MHVSPHHSRTAQWVFASFQYTVVMWVISIHVQCGIGSRNCKRTVQVSLTYWWYGPACTNACFFTHDAMLQWNPAHRSSPLSSPPPNRVCIYKYIYTVVPHYYICSCILLQWPHCCTLSNWSGWILTIARGLLVMLLVATWTVTSHSYKLGLQGNSKCVCMIGYRFIKVYSVYLGEHKCRVLCVYVLYVLLCAHVTDSMWPSGFSLLSFSDRISFHIPLPASADLEPLNSLCTKSPPLLQERFKIIAFESGEAAQTLPGMRCQNQGLQSA